MSFFIGDIEIKSKVILAPMAGITSFSYRKLMNKFGVGLTYTEMISDCGLIYKNNSTYELLKSDGSDCPLALQLFGGSKETLLKAIDELDKLNFQYDILDLNLACPVPKVVKNNGGSSWLKDQEKLYEMVSEICKKSKKPVSCKIRLGWDSVNVLETCKTLEKAGVKFIAIHARTRKELYTGLPHYEELIKLKETINIPFCVSGNIFTVEDGINALKITNADAVMVARGGIGNPELISDLSKSIEQNKIIKTNKDVLRQMDYLKEYANDLIEELGELKALRILRGIAPKFLDDIPNSKEFKKQLTMSISSKEELNFLIESIKVSLN